MSRLSVKSFVFGLVGAAISGPIAIIGAALRLPNVIIAATILLLVSVGLLLFLLTKKL